MATAIVLAAGIGARAGGDVPKQFRRIGGRTVVEHAVSCLRASMRISDILLVCAPDMTARAHAAGQSDTVNGGPSRRESVANALASLSARAVPPELVLVHDAARPFVPLTVLERLFDALDAGAAAATPVLPVADTLVLADRAWAGEPVSRENLMRVQTPQAFRFDVLCEAHRQWPAGIEATDDAQMVRSLGEAVRLVAGDHRLEKITMPEDFARIAALAGAGAAEEFRTGTGYDVHRLEPGAPLWLCGVEIAHDQGLAGHSDADVAIHALVDALLGALSDGDIGCHFPPSDPQWRGAPSHRFLDFARERVRARAGRIVHADVTIICEAPRIGPHREAMRARLGEILALGVDRVSVKATTTEGLGFAGRREGIAAQAVVTLAFPSGC